MNKLLPFLFVLCFTYGAHAQQAKQAPLIIQGKIANCPEKMLKIFFEDENNKLIIDTIAVNDAGEFYLKTFKLKTPQRTSLQQNRTQINNIYVAPGYNLTITGDASDARGLYKNKKITGIGAETNRYRVLLDSMYVVKNDTTKWYELDLAALLPFIQKRRTFEDSIAHVVFSRKAPKDPYFSVFERMVQMDNECMAFYYLLQHIGFSKYPYEKMTALVKEHTPKVFQQSISRDEYLVSQDYKTWVLPLYMEYAKQLDQVKDTALARQPDYTLQKIQALFTDRVREYYLYKTIQSGINGGSSVEKLNAAKKRMEPLVQALTNKAHQQDIAEAYSEKEKQVMQLQNGKPAPLFTLPSDAGKQYDLSGFKGKVVYLDLWASWCAPCRAEMPNFKQLYNKYKDNDKIAFIGIAVFDGEREWRKALGEDQPVWLQLYDKGGAVASAYVASAIPKYILIDKNGNVVNFNAPGPGTPEIGKLIEQEIAR